MFPSILRHLASGSATLAVPADDLRRAATAVHLASSGTVLTQ